MFINVRSYFEVTVHQQVTLYKTSETVRS